MNEPEKSKKAGRPAKPLAERFWSRVPGKPQDECWEWSGHCGNHGYGVIRDRKKFLTAHRVSYAINRGEIPNGLWVLHTCDNRKCVNPSHLFLGTHRDNDDDKMNKGRQSKGEQTGLAKVNSAEVREIRATLKTGLTQEAVGAKYGLHQSQVSRIGRSKSWAHIID